MFYYFILCILLFQSFRLCLFLDYVLLFITDGLVVVGLIALINHHGLITDGLMVMWMWLVFGLNLWVVAMVFSLFVYV